MTSPHAAEPAPPEACSACGAALDALGQCPKCGAVFGEAYRCPLCHAVSGIEASAALTYSCRTCGGPRLPPEAGASSEAEVASLRAARAEQLRAGAYRAGAGFALISGLLSFLVTNVVLAVTSPAPFARVAALVASVVPLVVSLLVFRRGATHKKEFEQALHQAWLLAAARVAGADPSRSNAASLAKTLRIDEARAEMLLAEVSVQDFVQPARVRVTELGDPEELALAAERHAAEGRAGKL